MHPSERSKRIANPQPCEPGLQIPTSGLTVYSWRFTVDSLQFWGAYDQRLNDDRKS